ncbi:DUF2989 domain-containing protein [Vibrio mangrovi]|uniref:DUF2989 domain-containing protein n=1 Tax=Vibrio mangrovi TaxID=474394 RepID=A0A1Y6IPM4_9VIBR|nr:DUF2989 domain-containing protein [Vibrio mangrovi]MDW6003603.1 DUF2989 domain-containing protein [Vibrio mangrovi]SMR99605.1 hypothetical protein VIM7927_00832 [Vibrio mangrovi]
MQQQIKYASLAITVFLLSGCLENTRNTDKLCQDNPELRCEELNINDGQCRVARTNLIWHRLKVNKNPTDVNKITEYELTQKYKQCLEVAAQIQPIDQAELKQRRFNALLSSGKNMERLEKELMKYNTPSSLYFLWSQTGDTQARRKFLQLEGKPEMESADLQYALATFYIDRDKEKTIKLLNHALELSDPEKLNTSIFESLASLNQLRHRQEASYIWAIVGKHFGVSVASPESMRLMYGFSEEKFDMLDDIADMIIDAVEDKEYHPSMMPEFKK